MYRSIRIRFVSLMQGQEDAAIQTVLSAAINQDAALFLMQGKSIRPTMCCRDFIIRACFLRNLRRFKTGIQDSEQ